MLVFHSMELPEDRDHVSFEIPIWLLRFYSPSRHFDRDLSTAAIDELIVT